MKYGNMIYFYALNTIGGIETWFYNLSQLYGDLDLTFVFNKGSIPQIKRLSKNVRVLIWDGKQRYECERLFVNFNLHIIPFVDADKVYCCLHGDYEDMVRRGQLIKENLPIHPRIDEYIGVSQTVCDAWKRLTGIDAKLCYNPMLPVEKRKVIRLCSAQRLTKEKGKDRICLLAKTMDDLCRVTGDRWMWDIYTDDTNAIPHSNIYYRQPRLDITDFLTAYDWFVQLSDNEGYCYSALESLVRGVPCVVTDLPVFRELGINKSNSLILDMNLGNITEVAAKIFGKRPTFEYEAPADRWGLFFGESKSTYEYREESLMLHKVEALDTYIKFKVKDAEVDRILPPGFVFEVSDARLKTLLGDNPYKIPFVKLLDEKEPVQNEPKDEEVAEKPKRGRKKKAG